MYALAGLESSDGAKLPAAKPAAAPFKGADEPTKKANPPPVPHSWSSNSTMQRMAPPMLTKKQALPPKVSGGSVKSVAGGVTSGAEAEFRAVAVGGGKEQVGATGWYKDIKQQYDPAVPNEYEDWVKEETARKKQRELERALQLKQEKANKALSSLAAVGVAADDDSKRQRLAPPGPPPPPAAAHAEGDGDPGLSMLQKMGWSEGSGLGKMGQGMKTPLMAKKMDANTGTIVNAPERPVSRPAPPVPSLPPPPPPPANAGSTSATPPGVGAASSAQKGAVTFRGRPSRVLLLKNMVGPGEVDPDLSGEIGEECSKYGEILKVTIYEVAEGCPPEEAVRIFVKFSRLPAAMKAYIDLDGRFFGGRKVWVCFFSEQNFDSNQLAPSTTEPKVHLTAPKLSGQVVIPRG